MKIAGIGSRETPKDILSLMTDIGAWAKKNQITVTSGHAEGADWAFEQGAQDYCEVYLPWPSFNQNLISAAQFYCLPYENALYITRQFHPAFDKLKEAGLKLMCRNAYQVLGSDLKSPVDAVICWTKDGKASGGTGQAIRIAKAYSIPVVNLFFEENILEIKKMIGDSNGI